ncbi:hypothetical protein [Halococcus sediminicola]|uniref:hypothetical protein n=1 Tax=Halococcus sediminicola TaxID=1264579 RepID=UPI000679C726|nr:hypothetical protein [Halococcus sediminicola]
MIPVSVDSDGGVSRSSTAVRLVMAVVLVAGLFFQRFQFALPIAAAVYALLEGYRVYTLSNQRSVEMPELVSRSGVLLRRVEIWAAIIFTFGFELLIGSLPLLGLLASALLYLGGLFTQVIRHQPEL